MIIIILTLIYSIYAYPVPFYVNNIYMNDDKINNKINNDCFGVDNYVNVRIPCNEYNNTIYQKYDEETCIYRINMNELYKFKGYYIQIITNNGYFYWDKLQGFITYLPNNTTKFLKIRTSQLSDPLIITENHYVYYYNTLYGISMKIKAKDLHIGQNLIIKDDSNYLYTDPIIYIEEYNSTGIYSPITENNYRLIVNNYIVSPFTNNLNDKIQNIINKNNEIHTYVNIRYKEDL